MIIKVEVVLIKMNNLFSEWKKVYELDGADHFVEDGIVSIEYWEKSKIRVLFILKETNNFKGNINELIESTVNKTRKKRSKLWQRPTFHNIGRWTYGLINSNNRIEPYETSHDKRKKALLSCAFINIKKTAGEKSSQKKIIDENAKKYNTFIKKQIDIIEPDIIVFSGTYKTIKSYVLPELVKVSYRVHTYKNIICINAFHPACTKARKEMYDLVVSNYYDYKKSLRCFL